MDIRPILYIIGIFLSTLAVFMTIPMFVDLWNNHDDWQVFAVSASLSGFFGAIFMLANKQTKIEISGKQAFLLTALTWVFLCGFAALPFLFADLGLSFTNAVFESVSGLTTTGSTIMVGLDNMPKGILIWRSILQWLGGVGIIVMAISVLPMLKVGGMQLFRLESSEKQKAVPRTAQLAKYILYIYTALTIICAIAYLQVGMSLFDAVAHAMTTIATGGFATKDSSFSAFNSYGPEIVAIIFMILGCLPFVLYIKFLYGDWQSLWKDEQVRTFLCLLTLLSTIISVYVYNQTNDLSLDRIIESIFTTVSLITGTGYSDTDYMTWGGFAVGALLFISCIGGCAGSTTCGIKIFRFQILYAVAKNQLHQLIYPNGVFMAKYNGQPISVHVAASVMAYFFIFVISFAVVSVLLLLCGLDLITSLSGAITSLANVGPGLGDIIGPTGTFEPLPDNAKWVLIISMILGRLEFLTLLVLFVPRFWRN